MTDTLTVWWGQNIVGSLRIDRHGDTSFCYAETWLIKPSARAISISLPLRAEPFSRRESRPFFEGLLPEEHQRAAAAGVLGLSVGNEFRLLEALGGEVAGALALWPEGERPPAEATSIEPAKPLDDDALIGMLNRLPTRPMLAGETGLRLSLAGAQAKLPVVVDNGHIALPTPGQPTTHILKPPIERFEGTTENEAFAMRLAREVGLSVAEVDYRRIQVRTHRNAPSPCIQGRTAGRSPRNDPGHPRIRGWSQASPAARIQVRTHRNAPSPCVRGWSQASPAARPCVRGRGFLLVERYDRVAGNGRVERLHQEDFCQALGFPSSRKYAADGGPVFRDCFQLLRSSATRPAREVLKLFDAAIFNLIIGNADAHAKNYSLLYRDNAVEMAPLYDLLATVAYSDLSPKLAMKIAGRATLDDLKPTDWGRFAKESGLTEPFVKRRAKALADHVLQTAGRIEAGFDLYEDERKTMRDYAGLTARRAAKLSRITR